MDINTVGQNELKQIRLIGDILAARIIKYREALGGYISEEQLSEVYGLPEDALENLKASVFIGSRFSPRMIKLNSDSLNIL